MLKRGGKEGLGEMDMRIPYILIILRYPSCDQRPGAILRCLPQKPLEQSYEDCEHDTLS